MEHLVTTTAFQPPPPALPTTSITSKSPPRDNKVAKTWNPPPIIIHEGEEPSKLLIQTSQRPDINKSLLSLYGFPLYHSLIANVAPPLADGLKFELHTLPVDAKAVADGDTVTVYVSTSDTRESSRVPQQVQLAVVECKEALAEMNYVKADALYKQIKHAGYRVLHINNDDILARTYRIRLRGIDAPERSMPYGKEAKDELVKMIDGKCLTVLVFGEDRYGRFVGDIYCNGIFVQESMLKKGIAWHYTTYDKRAELHEVRL
uniref:uncharacterized 38.1 kDa protein-like isoform X2 n=1 Tax=Erigeron canadensis TaxID=72917 RepID=UPI001CB9D29F|nr:uncharacterized 38.1 kDa protein-like isoform X2 [Erigeron canadensis]